MQPDVTKVGGISEQRRIAWMAQDFGVSYIGHGWNTALGLAADLQLAGAFPNADLVEYIGGCAYVDGIMTEPFRLDGDGMPRHPRPARASASLSIRTSSAAIRRMQGASALREPVPAICDPIPLIRLPRSPSDRIRLLHGLARRL